MVHNGIITNYKDIKQYLHQKGYPLESETDTEVICKLMKYIYDRDQKATDKVRKLREEDSSQWAGGWKLNMSQIVVSAGFRTNGGAWGRTPTLSARHLARHLGTFL